MDQAVKEEKKARRKFPDRATLTPEALDRVNLWLEQVEKHSQGIDATRSDIVNWFILSAHEALSGQQLKEIASKFHNPVKYARWALKEVARAAARGEQVEIKLVPASTEKHDAPKRQRRKKLNSPISTPVDSEVPA